MPRHRQIAVSLHHVLESLAASEQRTKTELFFCFSVCCSMSSLCENVSGMMRPHREEKVQRHQEANKP